MTYVKIALNPRYIERLEQVVRVLVELPPEKKFGINVWMTCGTIACACGWAGADPWFIRRGFETKKQGSTFNGSSSYNIFYDIHDGREAAQAFFGLSHMDFGYLFLSHRYPNCVSKKYVITRIKEFIEDNRETL